MENEYREAVEDCTHDCSRCASDCAARQTPESLLAPVNQYSDIRNVIAVVSGKGGVGKSLVSGLLACQFQRRTRRAAVLDADITGPSIPKMFGLDEAQAEADERGLLPLRGRNGLQVMSINLLLPHSTTPVLWRGPVVAGVVKQFWTDVCWGEVDYMLVDMPPGTGDVPLTVFQSLPIKGIVIVTSPQELVGMIVEKAVNMARMMNVPVLGLVENMSYYQCPDCGAKHELFGPSQAQRIAQQYGIENIARIPMLPELAAACDNGDITSVRSVWLEEFTGALIEKLTKI